MLRRHDAVGYPVDGVEVVAWNPRRSGNRILDRLGIGRPVDNFGDVAGPAIVAAALRRARAEGSGDEGGAGVGPGSGRLLSIGSILHLARHGDTVWGTGVNGKALAGVADPGGLSFRAVRGPRTRQWLREEWSIDCDCPTGDPFVTLPLVSPELMSSAAEAPDREYVVVPNLHDEKLLAPGVESISPRRPLEEIVVAVAAAETVVASSLHGIVLAELLGRKVVCARSGAEPLFKYEDYFLGTDRDTPDFAPDMATALADRRSDHYSPAEPLDAATVGGRLLDAFPLDLWGRGPQPRPSGAEVR